MRRRRNSSGLFPPYRECARRSPFCHRPAISALAENRWITKSVKSCRSASKRTGQRNVYTRAVTKRLHPATPRESFRLAATPPARFCSSARGSRVATSHARWSSGASRLPCSSGTLPLRGRWNSAISHLSLAMKKQQSPADILRNRYRRRMEARGVTYVEPALIRPVDGHGRPLSVAEILRLRFAASVELEQSARLEVASR